MCKDITEDFIYSWETQINGERINMKENKKYENLEEVKQEISRKDMLIKNLKEKVEKFDEVCLKNDKNSEILSLLFDRGIINENGDVLNKWKEDDNM